MNERYVSKADSRLMRFLNLFARGKFMEEWWTTLGNTIYYPTEIKDPMVENCKICREHELVHVRQFQRYGWLIMLCGYLLFPLPIIFSGRWYIERWAWLIDIDAKACSCKYSADLLWSAYAWAWPRKEMLAWFEAHKKV